ncbi:MAG TPA: cupin domain-containing protein [Longimicrobium sp.]
MDLRHALPAAAVCAATLLADCTPLGTRGAESRHVAPAVERGEGLVLQAGEGERRVRRPRPGFPSAQTTPFILKVDARNGASPDLVMGYDEIAPGQAIEPSRHRVADEIVFVHRGSGVARLGDRESPVTAGATVYVPRNTRVSLRNTGAEPLAVVFMFSKPGFERLMRESSVPEGEAAPALLAGEEARIQARNRWHTIADGSGSSPGGSRSGGLILQPGEGERRVRRPRSGSAAAHLTTPFILKVDRRNGGSRELVMGYEDIAPGDAIPPHRHLHADEIIFVHRGSGVAGLGTRQTAVGTGATVYIPRDTRITLRNTGSVPLGIVFVFSRPGFEELMRANSVLEGQPAAPLSPREQARIRARNRWHTVYGAAVAGDAALSVPAFALRGWRGRRCGGREAAGADLLRAGRAFGEGLHQAVRGAQHHRVRAGARRRRHAGQLDDARHQHLSQQGDERLHEHGPPDRPRLRARAGEPQGRGRSRARAAAGVRVHDG